VALHTGEAIGLVVNGKPLLRTWLTQQQLEGILSDAGTVAQFRIPGRSSHTYTGRLIRIEPAAASIVDQEALSYSGGGELRVDPKSGRPIDTLFLVDIESDADVVALDNHGCRVAIAFPRRYTSIARWMFDGCRNFIQELWLA
jgi:hypothetical protein